MNDNHKQHLDYILDNATNLISAKYLKGVKEYNSHLRDDYTIAQLLDNAIEEAIDELTYLLTMKEKLNEH
jgi:hypothetical protein